MVAPARYREYAPGAALAATVECFWSSAAPAPASPTVHRVLPDGCMDILFDFRAEARAPVTLVGTMSRALIVETEGPSELFGIRFHAGALPALLGLDAAELRDSSAEAGCFDGAFAGELWERLAEAPAAARPEIVRRALRPVEPDPLVAHCVGRIERAGGRLAVARLEAETGAGARRIERAFARHVGVGPKTFARIARFRALLEAARAGEGGWADLAAACGYADQPHMVREFKTLAGITPTEHFASGFAVGFVEDEGRAAA